MGVGENSKGGLSVLSPFFLEVVLSLGICPKFTPKPPQPCLERGVTRARDIPVHNKPR